MKTTKKITIILLTFVTAFLLCACGSESTSVSQDEFSNLQNDYNECSNNYDDLQNDYKKLESKYEELDSKYEKLSKEYESYKIEKETTIKYDEYSTNKEDYNTGITFDNLARTPNDYEGKRVTFRGKVVQVVESDTEVNIRLAIDDDYNKMIFLIYDPNIVSSRVLEDDMITIYGNSCNLYTYTSTFGGDITIPLIYVTMIEQ